MTVADSRKGGVARWAAERERRPELERQAAELLADELLRAVGVWIEVMRDEKSPAAARLQAADRIVERILGRVGEKLLVQKQERKEVTVRYDVERLAEIVGELRELGAIDGETVGEQDSTRGRPPPSAGGAGAFKLTRGWNGWSSVAGVCELWHQHHRASLHGTA